MLRNSASGPEIGLAEQILAGLLLGKTEIGPPAGLRPAGQNPARKADFRPGPLGWWSA